VSGRFRHDGTKSTRFDKPDDGDDRMNEKEEDVVHAGILSKSQNSQNSGRFWNSPPTGYLFTGARRRSSSKKFSRKNDVVLGRPFLGRHHRHDAVVIGGEIEAFRALTAFVTSAQ
jgi:hypothetical protein